MALLASWNSSSKDVDTGGEAFIDMKVLDAMSSDSVVAEEAEAAIIVQASEGFGDSESTQDPGFAETPWLPHPAFQIRRDLAEVVQGVQLRTIAPVTGDLREMARRALDRLEREREVDIQEWADRIAGETATADD